MSDSNESYSLPESLIGLFCEPSLMRGESAEVYGNLYLQVEEVVQPRDVFDQMMVSDVTNHFWEQQRIRRCSGGVIDTARRKALLEILTPMFGFHHQPAEEFADLYFGLGPRDDWPKQAFPPNSANHDQQEPTRSKATVVALLRKHGLDESAIDMVATRLSVTALAAMEELIHKHRVRRDAILEEIEHRRERRPAQQRRKALPQPNGKELPQEASPPIAGTPA
jgi:hypothetical protein